MKSSSALVGPVEVLEHEHGRRPGRRSARRTCARPRTAPRARRVRRSLDAEQREQRRLDPAALRLVRHVRARASPRSSPRVVGSSSPSARPARRRTISPSAQNVMPSPYAGRAAAGASRRLDERRRCTSRTPRPAGSCRCRPGPMTDTSRGRRSRPVAWSSSLSRRSSSSRPTNGASRPVAPGPRRRARPRPAAPARPAPAPSCP